MGLRIPSHTSLCERHHQVLCRDRVDRALYVRDMHSSPLQSQSRQSSLGERRDTIYKYRKVYFKVTEHLLEYT